MRHVRRAVAAAFLLAALGAGPATSRIERTADPLASDLALWSRYIESHPATDEEWTQTRSSMEPVIAQANAALREGRCLLALLRLASARPHLFAADYLSGFQARRQDDEPGFEAEWKRTGETLRASLRAPSPAETDDVRPAAVRALAEAAVPQIRGYYEASLEYGRNTLPATGLYYLGVARGERAFAEFCRTISTPASLTAPSLRSIAPEIDSLKRDLLALYRPPASIDRHGQFIGVSSILNEARQLDAAGLRYGALLRTLQAAVRIAPLRPVSPSLEPDDLRRRLKDLDAKLASASGVDHSIGRLFLEVAEAGPDEVGSNGPSAAAAIVLDVLPRYFAALSPAPAERPGPSPAVTVTLVRWPYT